MRNFLTHLSEPYIIMRIVVILIIIISKFGFGLNYISVMDIIKNHLNCFKNNRGKMLVVPIINYMVMPFFMGIATAMTKKISGETINIITIIVSILTAMLFALLTMVIDMKAKIKQNPQYFSTEAEVSKKSLLETYYTIMFDILTRIVLLIFCLCYCFTKKYGCIQSTLIYSLTYMLVINLMMIIKRIFRVIDTDMQK